VAFCVWAGGHLPSEAEWEYAACSAEQGCLYPWGDAPATCARAVMNDPDPGCGTPHTAPVCSKPDGNTLQGLCDMAGNAWEWVADDYHSNDPGAPSDGSAWVDSPRGAQRVQRGGSLFNVAEDLRAATRLASDPTQRERYVGFRCAR
jgi:formylglycine-generating enzyme required for sulfatase activity